MNRKVIAAGLIIGALVVYFGSHFVIEKRLQNLNTQVEEKITAQSESLLEITKLLARGAVTQEVELLLPECAVADMVEYDSLLSSLEKGLSQADVTKLHGLFSSCGAVTAQRRSMMTTIQAEMVKSLAGFVEIQTAVGVTQNVADTEKWVELAKKEQSISELFLRLVDAQEAIIVALRNNVPATSVTVENIRASAQTLREDMITLTEEVVVLRTELQAI